ncbi:MOSC domain-containing protein [Vibrio sp. B1Z05]|uniref:MOSC domain-containing protein n=1 Tax=Vibrio sp. B1Z05 TaxID=2654980 RepID=UPI00132C0FDA|nr:MOSC domain-containing protein [Vibrio sp. B1Z05]
MKDLAQLSGINIFPVKSTSGIAQSRAYVGLEGISFDRRFVVTDTAGRMITARKYPKMVTIKSTLLPDGILLSAPNAQDLHLSISDLERNEFECKIWSDRFFAYTTTDTANQWFSNVLGTPALLLYCGEESNRYREKLATKVSFADGYPLLVISQGSLDELNRSASHPQSMSQFRTNLVIEGVPPFAEDSWEKIAIGEVEFKVGKACQRCVLTSVDPKTGEKMAAKEPTATLAKFRADEKGAIFFGMNLIALNEGVIEVGDELRVLETRTAITYTDTRG